MTARGAALATLLAALAGCSLVRDPEPDEVRAPAAAELRAPPLEEPVAPEARVPEEHVETRSLLGNAPFYDVDGKRYFVRESEAGLVERGQASWYGGNLHGRRTASGERFDMHQLTAAHRTLPLPTEARVTNLDNGRSVVVRINDRGPFRHDRIIDVSYAAARELGMLRTGTARVEMQTLNAPQAPPGRSLDELRLYAQVGAFASRENAARVADRLRAQGFTDVEVRTGARDGVTLQRVVVGPVTSAGEFDELVQRLRAAGFEAARLALD
jgi:rare lipoprotein A